MSNANNTVTQDLRIGCVDFESGVSLFKDNDPTFVDLHSCSKVILTMIPRKMVMNSARNTCGISSC